MGIQMWTGDQAPQLRLAGTQALASGISGGLNSLGDALEKAMTKKKNDSQLATVLRKKHSILNPERKDDFNMMSLAELQGEDLAFAEQALQRKRQMEEEEFMARQDERMRRAAEEERARAFNESIAGLTKPDNATLGDFFENPENYPQGQPKSRAPSLQEILGAAAQHGQILNGNLDNLIKSLAGPPPPRGLPLGAVKSIDGVGTIVGTGENFEPNFVPTPRVKPEEPTAPNYPWLFTDDKNVFTNNLLALDPKSRDAAIAARKAYNSAIGRDDPLREALAQLLGGKQPDKAGGGSPAPASTGGTLTKGADGKYYFKP